MKKHLLTAGLLGVALLLLDGCNVLEQPFKHGIQFDTSTSSSGISTKAAFGNTVAGYQLIDWENGDQVRIAAKYARSGNGDFAYNGSSFFDYTVGSISQTSHYSKGKLQENGQGLFWNPDFSKTADEFWSIYPAASASSLSGGTNYNGAISGTIPSTTPLASKPPLMVAHAVPTSNTNGATVTLYYTPAFTTFLIALTNNTGKALTLDSFSISAADNSPALAGTFSGVITGTGEDATVSVTNVSNASRQVTSARANGSVAAGGVAAFYIFCLPQTLQGLQLNCTYTVSGEAQVTKTMDLSDYTFAACVQHRLNLSLEASGDFSIEISEMMKVILANAFPDLFDYIPGQEGYQLRYINETDEWGVGNLVPEEVIRQKILEVRNVTISKDYGGAVGNSFTAEDMAAFVNLEQITFTGTANSLVSVSIDGLQHFKEFLMESSGYSYSNLHNVSIKNCPLTETVVIDSQSLQTVELENLTGLKNITVCEGAANSNMQSFSLSNCPDLEVANFGLVGALQSLDLHDCSKMTELSIATAYALSSLNLQGCSSLKTLDIVAAQRLATLDLSDCQDIETIKINDAQCLTSLIARDKPHLQTIDITSSAERITTVELVNLPELSSLSYPTSSVTSCTVSNCDALTELYMPSATSLQTLTLSDNDNLESIILTNPTQLTSFSYDSSILKTLKFNGDQGSRMLETLSLNAPALTTVEFTNTSNVKNCSLSNLSSGFTSLEAFLPLPYSWSGYGNLEVLSLTNCSGFTDLVLQGASQLSEMHFDSCANLSSVTLINNNNVSINSWSSTSSIVATKTKCPNLNDYYTVDNWGSTAQFNFN